MARQLFAQLSKDSLVYGLGAALTKLIGFVLVPLYTKTLPLADFALLGLLTPVSAVLGSLLILGLDAGVALTFYKTEDRQERKAVISTFLTFELVLSFVVCALLFFLAQPLSVLLLEDTAYTVYFQLAIAVVPFATLITIFLDAARLSHFPWRYLMISVGSLTLTAAIIVVMVLGFGLGLEGVLIGTLAGNLLFSIIAWRLMSSLYTGAFSKSKLLLMLRLGLPLLPASLAYWVINFSSRWFMVLLGDKTLDPVAILTFATNLSAPVVLIVTAFQIAWVPFSLSIARNSAAHFVYARTLLYFLALSYATLILIVLAAVPLIDLLARPAYLPALDILALVGLCSIASGAFGIVATGVNLEGRTLHVGWTAVLAAPVSIALNLLLIPIWGVVGAAVASLISNMVPIVLLYRVAQRVHRVPYDLLRIGLLTAAAAVALVIATLLSSQHTLTDILPRVAVFAVFVILFIPIGVIRISDLRELSRMLRLRVGA